ncbi:MAG TPA: transglycosylase domain-containing protein, partial [Kofleriaceae bacterium]|nr:transglycosylase domain-containing protein [Kofleriaceae bacterium]
MRFPNAASPRIRQSRLRSIPGRWLWAGGITLGTLLLIALGLGVIYPRVGAYMIRKRLSERLAAKIDRKITVGDIDVALGHAVLRDVNVRGKLDGDTPLVHVERIDVDFDTAASLVGKVELGNAVITDVNVTLRRNDLGQDNVQDVIDHLRSSKDKDKGSGGRSQRPKKITVKGIRMLADDAMTGTTALIKGGDATWTPDATLAHIEGISATTPNAPRADIKALEIRKASGSPPVVTVDGGELSLWPKMSLSGIAGTIVADPDNHGHYLLDFAGGYGGVPGRLWTAKGGFSPADVSASLDLVAARFELERIAPILAKSAVVDYQTTSVDAQLHVTLDHDIAQFSGDMNLSGLNLGHPMIADKEVHDLDMSAKIAGSLNRATRTVELTRGDFVLRDVPFSITGTVVKPARDVVTPEAQQTKKDPKDLDLDDVADGPVKTRGPYGIQLAKMRLVIPPISCQKFINALPPEMVPYMQGYKIKGMFDTDVELDIDWTNLDATVLDGHVGIKHCKVLDEPSDSPKRLMEPFEHFVEVDEGEWISFIVGPENPDFVPITELSPYMIKSIITTEDGAFYQHHGFIVSEFKSALIRDLKAGKFKYGASSITMQMVKNVLLYREKTLARKLQELFLTWHVENTLEKDRILEIYFNVIEFGPGIYGIGQAAREWFGKSAKDLNPVETAFFSTILPNPKDRYRQFCQQEVFKWTQAKIDRILALELKRDRLTQEEYDKAVATPLVFAKNQHMVEHKDPKTGETVMEPETEKECLDRVKDAIDNARPTS